MSIRGGRAWLLAGAALAPALLGGRRFYRARPQELWLRHFLLPPVPALRVASLGEEASLADLLYTSTTLASDYYRDRAAGVRIDTTANAAAFQLDPDFSQAIYWGHLFAQFSAYRPGGRFAAENDARRIAFDNTSYLLLLGFHRSPRRAEFAETLSQELLELKDFDGGAHCARLALAKQEDALVARSLLGLVALKGGDLAAALPVWEELERRTRDQSDAQARYFNAVSKMRILAIREHDGLAAAQEVVDRHRERTGRPPADWGELVRAGALRAPPRDRLGRPYLLMPESGRVLLTPLTGAEVFK